MAPLPLGEGGPKGRVRVRSGAAGASSLVINSALALQAEDLQKTFGAFTALGGINLDVKRGEFLALFGRNGAGKTTFLKIAAMLMKPTHGKLHIEGLDIQQEPEKARQRIGFLSHNTYLYRDLTPVENLRFFGRLYGIDDIESRIPPLLERVGLRRRAKDPVRSFSRGCTSVWESRASSCTILRSSSSMNPTPGWTQMPWRC